MITKIEALNFRCLRYISQPLDSFHILVGPNASGKTTFLDIIAFISQLVSDGLDAAIYERTQNFHDLIWEQKGESFEIAVEARIPDEIRKLITKQRTYDTVRYEIAIGIDDETKEISIKSEKAILKTSSITRTVQKALFPWPHSPLDTETIMTPKGLRNTRTVINKVRGGNDNFYSEVYQESGKGWAPAFKLGPRKSALGNLPADETKFPATTWLKSLFTEGVQIFVLNSLLIRKASPPGQRKGFKPDGSNLPWVIDDLIKKNPAKFSEWIAHLQTALPDIEGIRIVEREDDRHRYLRIKYKGGLEIPSWVVSDGTLRLLALTLPAYIPELQGIYLIEEPENGIHPKAVETVFQSLSSVYGAQILLATHSPVLLGIAKAEQVLCFAKTEEGATDIVSGNFHPALIDWKGDTDLGTLFASGVLG